MFTALGESIFVPYTQVSQPFQNSEMLSAKLLTEFNTTTLKPFAYLHLNVLK